MSDKNNAYVRQVAEQKYEFGFTTDVHTEIIEKGLNEDIVRLISAKKGEPEWMLEFRLKAFRYWKEHRDRFLKSPLYGMQAFGNINKIATICSSSIHSTTATST